MRRTRVSISSISSRGIGRILKPPRISLIVPLVCVALQTRSAQQHNITKTKLLTMDILVLATMKNAAKCDTQCELQNSVNHQNFERILRPRVLPGACLFQWRLNISPQALADGAYRASLSWACALLIHAPASCSAEGAIEAEDTSSLVTAPGWLCGSKDIVAAC